MVQYEVQHLLHHQFNNHNQISMNMVTHIKLLVVFFSVCCYLGSISSSLEIHNHTPNRSSLINLSHGDYSPSTGTFVPSPTTVFQTSSSPQSIQTNFLGQYRN